MRYTVSKILFLTFIFIHSIAYSKTVNELLNNAMIIKEEQPHKALNYLHEVEQNYKNIEKDSLYYLVAHTLSDIYFDLHNESLTLFYLKEAKNCSLEADTKDSFNVRITLLEAKYYSRYKDCDSALNYLNGIDTTLFIKDDDKFSFYHTIAITQKRCNNYEKAIEFIKLCNNLNVDSNLKGLTPLLLAQIVKKTGNLDQALSYLTDAKELLSDNTHAYRVLLSTLGSTLFKLEKHDEAERVYIEILENDKTTHFQKLIAINDLSSIYREKREYDNAISILNKGEQIAKKDSILIHLANIYGNKGLIFFEQKKFEEAYHNFKRCEEIFVRLGKSNNIDNLTYAIEQQILSHINALNDKKLMVAFSKYLPLRDSIEIRNINDQVQDFNVKYKTEKKEQELIISNQEKEIETAKATAALREANNFKISTAITMILLFLLAFALSRIFKLKNYIEALRSAQSHATSNSYNRVLYVIEEHKEAAENEETILVLNRTESLISASAVIHNTIEKIESDISNANINFSNGFRDLCNKLKLFIIHEKDVEVNIYCDDDIIISNKSIQSLFLLIEELFTNASKHAFSQQPNPKINIALRKLDSRVLQLTYVDNGIGLAEIFDVNEPNVRGFEVIKNLVRNLKGKINSIPSKGISFQFDFDYRGLTT